MFGSFTLQGLHLKCLNTFFSAEKSQKLPYYVDRTRFHQLPVYFLEMDGGSRQITEVRRVGGDIWVSLFSDSFNAMLLQFSLW